MRRISTAVLPRRRGHGTRYNGKYAGIDIGSELECKYTKHIAWWLQRVILCSTGLGEEFFIDKYGTA